MENNKITIEKFDLKIRGCDFIITLYNACVNDNNIMIEKIDDIIINKPFIGYDKITYTSSYLTSSLPFYIRDYLFLERHLPIAVTIDSVSIPSKTQMYLITRAIDRFIAVSKGEIFNNFNKYDYSLFYQLSYTKDDYDEDPWEKNKVTLSSLYNDKKEEICTLTELDFVNMNEYFDYSQSIIFMKPSSNVEFKRFLDCIKREYENKEYENVELILAYKACKKEISKYPKESPEFIKYQEVLKDLKTRINTSYNNN